MKPTFLRVGVPKNTVRPPTSILPPTETAGAPSQTDETHGFDSLTGARTISVTPPTHNKGDRLYLYIFIYQTGGDVVTPPSGFTERSTFTTGGELLIYSLDVSTAITNADFTVNSSALSVHWNCFTVKNPGSDYLASGWYNNPGSNVMDPPAVTPSAGAGDYLVLTFNAGATGNTSPATGSTGYTDIYQPGYDTGFGEPFIMTQKKFVAISVSEDPGSFTFPPTGTGATSLGFTIAVLGKSASIAPADHTHTLASGDFTDVDVTGVTVGDMLRFDGTDWVPA